MLSLTFMVREKQKLASKDELNHLYVCNLEGSVDRGFCLAWSHSYSVRKKHTEAYIDYKLVGLLAQTFLLTNSYIIP